MHTLIKLLRLQIDNKTDILKTNSLKKMTISVLKRLFLLIVLILGIGYLTIGLTGLGFKINAEFLSIVLLALQVVSLIFGIGSIITNLYLSKDNEILMGLPTTPNQLFMSKILMIYFHELSITATLAIPLFLSFGIIGSFGLSFFLCIPIYVIILPLLPISIAAFLSIPVMVVLKFLKKHMYLSVVLVLAAVATILTLYVSLLGKIAGGFDIASKQIETIIQVNSIVLRLGKALPLYFQLGSAMTTFDSWGWIFIYFVGCQGIMILTILFIRPLYFKTAMSSLENTFKLNAKKDYVERKPFVSLLLKEIKCVFRSPGNVFEYFLFTLLMPFIVLSYDKLLLTISVNQAGENMIAGSHLMIVAILAMLSNIISASSISRDGGNFYISKIIPVNYYTQIAAKLVFNAIFTVGAILVTMCISFIYQNPVQVILGSFAVIFAAIGHIAMSLDMDIKKPILNYQGNEDNSAMQKNTVKSTILGLGIGIIMGLIVIGFAFNEMTIIPYVILLVLGLAFGIYRIYMLILRIYMQYDKIEM